MGCAALLRRGYPNYGVAPTEHLCRRLFNYKQVASTGHTIKAQNILSILVLCRRHYRCVKRDGCAALPRRGYPNYGGTPAEHLKTGACLLQTGNPYGVLSYCIK
jgi:hypothetical protein